MDNVKHVDTPLMQNAKFELDNGFPKINKLVYKSLIGSLLYFCASKPDIMFAASILSRFISSPSQNHYQAAIRVLRYIKRHSKLWSLVQMCR